MSYHFCFLVDKSKKCPDNCITLNDVVRLFGLKLYVQDFITKTLHPEIKPAVTDYLNYFKQHTQKNVLENDISVVLDKNSFVTGKRKL